MQSKIYTIYLLTSPSGKKYCGYTSQSVKKRWQNGYGYEKCPALWPAIEKYGWENFIKEIVFQTNNQEEAFQKEKDIIASLDLQNPEKGYNIDQGGQPTGSSFHLTPEGRKKISEAGKRKWANPEFQEYMRQIGKLHPPSRQCIEAGIKASALARKGKVAHNAKQVEQLDKDNLTIIQTFSSATAAAIAIMGKESGCSNILNVCKGKRKTAYGYKWRFKENEDIGIRLGQ